MIAMIMKKITTSIITTIATKGFFRYLFSFYKKPLRRNRNFIDILKEYLT